MEVAVGIVAQRENERAQGLAARLVGTVSDEHTSIVVDEETGTAIDRTGVPVSRMTDCDLLVSVGGDGTFLFVAREAGDVPIVGVNLGEVGFLNAVQPADAIDAVSELVAQIRDGSFDGHPVRRLHAAGEDWTLPPALNEVVVHGPKRGRGGGATISIAVDGSEYTRGGVDGVLVATPTGSTAYNLSEGGPLVQPSLEAFVVTQMAPTNPMPSLVVDADSELTLTVTDAPLAYAIVDGRERRTLDPPTTVIISRANAPVTLAGPSVDFFEALEKLE